MTIFTVLIFSFMVHANLTNFIIYFPFLQFAEIWHSMRAFNSLLPFSYHFYAYAEVPWRQPLFFSVSVLWLLQGWFPNTTNSTVTSAAAPQVTRKSITSKRKLWATASGRSSGGSCVHSLCMSVCVCVDLFGQAVNHGTLAIEGIRIYYREWSAIQCFAALRVKICWRKCITQSHVYTLLFFLFKLTYTLHEN